MALRDGDGGVATVELLELARDGATVQGLGQQQHTLLQRAQLRHASVTLNVLIISNTTDGGIVASIELLNWP